MYVPNEYSMTILNILQQTLSQVLDMEPGLKTPSMFASSDEDSVTDGGNLQHLPSTLTPEVEKVCLTFCLQTL